MWAHCRTRARVEMTIGILKSRFQCLQKLRVTPERHATSLWHVLFSIILQLLEESNTLPYKSMTLRMTIPSLPPMSRMEGLQGTSSLEITFDYVMYFLLFSLFLLFIIFTHHLHKECFCFRRRTQMCSSTTYGDIQITLSANSVP